MNQDYEMVKRNTDGNTVDNRDVCWNDINFSINNKDILNNVYGSVKMGQVAAIMGPSGAGKSSLLNVLAGRSSSGGDTKISGEVTVGGTSINPVDFRQNIAYVMQDDAILATMTPREALRFSAKLRTEISKADDEIDKDVDELLTKLGIQECADVMIGGPLLKGISGGQRKRTSVGVEIITKPQILFLDEPTSGLDSYQAFNLVKMLNDIAITGTPVLCTIHQPSSEIFYLFDICIFMKSGRIFWQGPTKSLANDLNKMGYPLPENYNPCDHAMFICTTVDDSVTEKAGLFAVAPPELAKLNSNNIKVGDVDLGPPIKSSFWQQLIELGKRDIQDVIRDKPALIGRFGVTIFLNLLFGLIFFDAGNGDGADSEAFSAHFGALTMTSISTMFGSANATLLAFPFTRPIFMREYSTGTYYASAYFLSKMICELPLAFLQTLAQYLVAYFLIAMNGNFFLFVLIGFGNGLAASSIALLLGCIVPDAKVVTELSPLLFVPQLLFCGFFIRTSLVPVFLRWAQYLCSLKYSLNLVLLTEFASSNDNCRESAAALDNCKSVLDANDIKKEDTHIYVILLILIFFVFRSFGCYALVQKSKRFY